MRAILNIVNVVLKAPSSLQSTAPVESIYIDNKIASQISSLAKSVNDKLISMSEGLFSEFGDLLGQFKLEMTNASYAAEPEVSGLTPESGQLAPPCQNCCLPPANFRVPQRA